MVKFEDSSLVDKISFLFTTSGFLLVLFSFGTFLNSNSDGSLAMFIISFLLYLIATLTIVCYVTMDQVEDGTVIRAVHMASSFLAGVFLVIGMGLDGELPGHPAPYSSLLGVCALLLILASFGLGIFSFLVANRSTTTTDNSTTASGPSTFTG